MVDAVIIGSVGTILISIISILGGYLLKLHIKKCSLCNKNLFCECIDDNNNNNKDNNKDNNNIRKISSSSI
jgi:hypothetical protein